MITTLPPHGPPARQQSPTRQQARRPVRTLLLHSVLLTAPTLLASCDAESSRPPAATFFSGDHQRFYADVDAGEGGAPAGAVSRHDDEYPAGPYAEDPSLGETVENVAFQGFFPSARSRLASDGAFATVSLAELRKSDTQYLIVNVSSIWCAPCLPGAETLARRAEEAAGLGATILELVLDGSHVGMDPSVEELRAWIDAAELGVMTVRAGDDDVRRVFVEREHAFVIELATMKVVWKAAGFYTNTTVADEAINALARHQQG